jgi:ribosomal protein L29
MATKDLKKKSVNDLEKDLKTKRLALKDFRFGVSGSKAKDSKKGVNLRKDIARILTELNSRK